MWWTKVEMKQGKIAATRDLRPTSRLQCSLTSSAGGGSMRTTARVEEIPEEEAQPKPKSKFPPATSAPSMSRFKLQQRQLKVLRHLLVHLSRSDRRRL